MAGLQNAIIIIIIIIICIYAMVKDTEIIKNE